MQRFVLLDSITELEPHRFIRAAATFDAEDPIFRDHFPGCPVVPGSLLLEVMAQAGGWLIFESAQRKIFPILCMSDRTKFRRPVAPGQRLTIESRVESWQANNFCLSAQVVFEGRRAAQSRIFYNAVSQGVHGFSDEAMQSLLDWGEATLLALLEG